MTQGRINDERFHKAKGLTFVPSWFPSSRRDKSENDGC